jgi:hypothetical protein
MLKNGVLWDVTPCGNIPEDTIPHSHRCENRKSYILFILSADEFYTASVMMR